MEPVPELQLLLLAPGLRLPPTVAAPEALLAPELEPDRLPLPELH